MIGEFVFLLQLTYIFYFFFSRSSKYLKMPKKLLYRSLGHQLNHRIKKKNERKFILSRVQLLDRQFCLVLNINLYHSYVSEGKHYKMWPVSQPFHYPLSPI